LIHNDILKRPEISSASRISHIKSGFQHFKQRLNESVTTVLYLAIGVFVLKLAKLFDV
jgi:hypothetical protein